MARRDNRFVCQACGAVHSKWAGRCEACGAWNSVTEETVEADGLSTRRAETLVRRLRAMPVVLGVAIGWRQAERAAA